MQPTWANMITLRETTKDWTNANHTYIVSDDKQKLHGYIKEGEVEPTMFANPMKFDTRRRTFVVVK